MNMAGLGGWRGLSRALKCFGVRGFLRARRQDLSLARCMAHNLVRARKSESIRARIWYPGGYPGIPEMPGYVNQEERASRFSSCRHTLRALREGGCSSAECAIKVQVRKIVT